MFVLFRFVLFFLVVWTSSNIPDCCFKTSSYLRPTYMALSSYHPLSPTDRKLPEEVLFGIQYLVPALD